MKIFHYHRDTGVFLGEGLADPSPMEPGVWLVPAHATNKQPPKIKKGEQAIWSGKNWVVEPIPVPKPKPEPAPEAMPIVLTPEQRLEAVGLSVADLRQLLGLEATS